MIKFKEKIEAAQKKLDQLKSDVAEMVGLAEAEGRDFSDEESTKLEAWGEEIESTVKRIENLEKAEKALGASVIKSQGGDAPAIINRRGFGREREKGELLFRHATCALIGHYEKKSPDVVAAERYKHDPDVLEVVKTAVNPAQTDVSGWASELVDDSLQGFLDLLRGESVAADLLSNAGVQLQFDGLGSIKIPGRGGTSTDLASGWTGESDAIPVKRATTTSQTISPYKWGVISTFSKELAMRSTPSIESLVRQFILDDTATKLDNDFLGTAAAVAAVRPAGMFNGVTGTGASSATALADKIIEDLNALVTPILTANMGKRLVILMNPVNAFRISNVRGNDEFLFRDDIRNGVMGSYRVVQSTNIAANTLLAIDMNEIAWAPGTPMFTVSDTATIVEVNDDGTDPTMGADETPRTPSGTVADAARDDVNNPPIRSLFQTETVALKHVQYMSWHKLRSGCVNRITSVDYS
jgi:HK97 family phage major capsid protein